MNLGLGGKAALITGAAGGIGSATARLFAQQGIAVALFDRDGEGAERVAADLRRDGATAIAGTMDVRDLDAFTAAVTRAEQELGGLDFVVSVAGGGTRQTLSTLSIDDWHAVIDLNLTGPFNAIKAGAPALRRRGGGAIVTVGSLAGLRMSMNNGVSYTAAKAGVIGLTRHAAYELGRDGIRVNAVLPGPVLTPQMKAKISAETLARVPRELPLGRWVQPEEVAAPILFFCSPMSSACTGTHVIIDSGLHVGATSSRDEYDRTRDAT
ncbi:SDR family NAD(P)-dependent oxidoreductase [Ramlibacter sp.]|uniref:SDR family NAD(P)-dependent oxidoreductase n=1 Tax=Ramlibacter sp. TaxID=1917967 RepID=UPI0035B117FB